MYYRTLDWKWWEKIIEYVERIYCDVIVCDVLFELWKVVEMVDVIELFEMDVRSLKECVFGMMIEIKNYSFWVVECFLSRL